MSKNMARTLYITEWYVVRLFERYSHDHCITPLRYTHIYLSISFLKTFGMHTEQRLIHVHIIRDERLNV